jgi:hypothetical protein
MSNKDPKSVLIYQIPEKEGLEFHKRFQNGAMGMTLGPMEKRSVNRALRQMVPQMTKVIRDMKDVKNQTVSYVLFEGTIEGHHYVYIAFVPGEAAAKAVNELKKISTSRRVKL